MNSLLFSSCILACVGLAALTNPFLPPLPEESKCFDKCEEGICNNVGCLDFNNDGQCDVCEQEPENGLCQCLFYFPGTEDCRVTCSSNGLNQRCEFCGDFDNDGKCDVCTQEPENGECQCLIYAPDNSTCGFNCLSNRLNERCQFCPDVDNDGWCDDAVCRGYEDGKCADDDCDDDDQDGFCDDLCEAYE